MCKKISSIKIIKKLKRKWFTLVELVVVITILAILGTIAFVSFQSYWASARDWVRLSDMRSISKWLLMYHAKSGLFPMPEKYATITASWIIIRYQWVAWPSTLNTAWIWWISQWAWRDPKTEEYFTYTIDWEWQQHNLVWYFETTEGFGFNNFFLQANASYTWWLMKSIWASLWMVYEQNSNIPIHEQYPNWTTIDIRNSSTVYNVKFSYQDEIAWTWTSLYTAFYNRDRYMLSNKDLAQLDNSLVLYLDMETTTTSWSLIVMKDFSKSWANWVCYDWSTIVSCSQTIAWPRITNGYMRFDGSNDYVRINKNVYSQEMTILLKIKPEVFWTWRYGFVWYQNPTSDSLRPFNMRMSPSQLTAWIGWFHYDMQDSTATDLTPACGQWKRCTDNLNYQYTPDANEAMQFYVAMKRTPPNVSININWKPFINRNCRSNPTNFWQCPWPQYQWYNSFHSNFNYLRIWRVDNYFRWTIDEVRVYNRALTDAEISYLYASTSYKHNISIN